MHDEQTRCVSNTHTSSEPTTPQALTCNQEDTNAAISSLTISTSVSSVYVDGAVAARIRSLPEIKLAELKAVTLCRVRRPVCVALVRLTGLRIDGIWLFAKCVGAV